MGNDLEEPKVVKEEPPSPANAPIEQEPNCDQESDPDWSPITSPAATPASTQRKKKTVVKPERGKVKRGAPPRSADHTSVQRITTSRTRRNARRHKMWRRLADTGTRRRPSRTPSLQRKRFSLRRTRHSSLRRQR